MAKRDGRFIAGALNLIGSDTLYGRYWGAIEDHPCLHFEVCYYQAIEFALAHGLRRVEAGAQGRAQACARLSADAPPTPLTTYLTRISAERSPTTSSMSGAKWLHRAKR